MVGSLGWELEHGARFGENCIYIYIYDYICTHLLSPIIPIVIVIIVIIVDY